MMDIKCISVNILQENCYIVSDETRECVIIDCGAYYEAERKAIVDYLRNEGLSPRHLLCTHGHMDHVFGADTIFEAFGLKPEIHREDEELLLSMDQQTRDMMGVGYDRPMPAVGRYLEDGDTVNFGSHELQVIHTPGHSPGGVVFYCEAERVVFTGDTLFRMSVGRTDLHRGSWPQLMESLAKRLAPLPADTIVYPGHGPASNIGDEVRMNPFFR
ncbi:MAG: MBL fold metallo-hydrolase [Prevotella sp.]|nr:MBL fold metallo-hydrolase [Prevotella sp.]